MEVVIEHNKETCGPCGCLYKRFCYLFGDLSRHTLERVTFRHPQCLKHAEPLEDRS